MGVGVQVSLAVTLYVLRAGVEGVDSGVWLGVTLGVCIPTCRRPGAALGVCKCGC